MPDQATSDYCSATCAGMQALAGSISGPCQRRDAYRCSSPLISALTSDQVATLQWRALEPGAGGRGGSLSARQAEQPATCWLTPGMPWAFKLLLGLHKDQQSCFEPADGDRWQGLWRQAILQHAS